MKLLLPCFAISKLSFALVRPIFKYLRASLSPKADTVFSNKGS